MDYDTLIATVGEIVHNEAIYTEGLTLVYELEEDYHRKLDEHFHYKTEANKDSDFEHTDDFEVEIGGIIIKFIKKIKK